MKKLNYPFDEKQIRALKVGDMVMISGKLFTGRDAVHKYLHEGGKSPVNLKNQIIYHCGQLFGKRRQVRGDGRSPTTSIREEPYNGRSCEIMELLA